jgi:hypothetical protein
MILFEKGKNDSVMIGFILVDEPTLIFTKGCVARYFKILLKLLSANT